MVYPLLPTRRVWTPVHGMNWKSSLVTPGWGRQIRKLLTFNDSGFDWKGWSSEHNRLSWKHVLLVCRGDGLYGEKVKKSQPALTQLWTEIFFFIIISNVFFSFQDLFLGLVYVWNLLQFSNLLESVLTCLFWLKMTTSVLNLFDWSSLTEHSNWQFPSNTLSSAKTLGAMKVSVVNKF